jgi:hypothetical protein
MNEEERDAKALRAKVLRERIRHTARRLEEDAEFAKDYRIGQEEAEADAYYDALAERRNEPSPNYTNYPDKD